MAEIVGLDGKARDGAMPGYDTLSVLKGLINSIEDGSLRPQKVFVIVEELIPGERGGAVYPTFDNGITVAEAVFLLETAKADIFEKIRQ